MVRPLCLSLFTLATLYAQSLPTWTPLGPRAINGRTADPESGKIQTFAASASNPSIMYAGGGLGSGSEGPFTGAGIFKSTDGGTTWTPVNSGLTDTYVNALWVSPTDSNVALAGTEYGGIFRSANGGASWTSVGNYTSVSEFLSVGSSVLAGVGTGILASNDGGATWGPIQGAMKPVRALASGGSAVIAGTDGGAVLLQTQPGQSFQTIMQPGSGAIWSVAVNPNDPTNAYAVIGIRPPPLPSVLMVTTNSGGNWTQAKINDMAQSVVYGPDGKLYVGTSNGIYTSTDGVNFTYNGKTPWDVRRVFFTGTPATMTVASDQGLHRSSDSGNTFHALSGNVGNSILTGLAVHGSTILTTVQDFDPILSYDGGATWTQPSRAATGSVVSTGLVGEIGTSAINSGNPNYCYAYTQAAFYYSKDACKTFTKTSAPALLQANSFVLPAGADIIAPVPGAQTVYVGTANGVLKSADYGVTFSATTWPFTQVTAIGVNPANVNMILVGSTKGLSASTDGGGTWASVSTPGTGYPTTIAYSTTSPNVVLIGLNQGPGKGGGMLRSADSGATFQLSNSGLSTTVRNMTGYSIVDEWSARFSSDGVAALATSTGIYLSYDTGQTWQNITSNSIATYFTEAAWDSGYLYASTFGGGVVRTQIPAPALTPSPASLSFTSGGAAQTVVVTANRPGLAFTVAATTQSSLNWLTVTPTSGATPANLTVGVNASGFLPGNYSGQLTITAGSAPAVTIPVTLVATSPVPGTEPVIKFVVNGASFQSTIAPGMFLTVIGTDLSQTTRSWGDGDFINGALPTSLDGVSVSIGGKAAYIDYISPGQINLLAPAGVSVGTSAVLVKSPLGISAPTNATVSSVAPAFFLISGTYPAALHPDYSLVGPSGLFPGTTPAAPGETIQIYATGFGATNPATPDGVLSIPVAPLASAPTVTVGGKDAKVVFAGIVSPGLYQLNVTIPDLPDGDASLVAQLNGATAPAVTIAVAKK
jgi:uncharacterized protein (TIGR03437 family)